MLMVLESACIPVPSEVTMIYAGYLVSQGEHELRRRGASSARWRTWSARWIAWAAGAYGVDAVAHAHRAQPPPGRRRRTSWFERYGTPTVFFARLLPVVRTFISLPAGRRPDAARALLRADRPRARCRGASCWSRSATSPARNWDDVAPPVRLSRLRRGGRRDRRRGLAGTASAAAGPATRVAAMPVPLMDIRGQYADLLDDVKRSVCEVIDSGRFILGPNMRALEEEVAAAIGCLPRRRGRQRHGRARAQPRGARRRPGRRGHHDRLHVLRDRRGHRPGGRDARCSPTSTGPRSTSTRRPSRRR